MEAGVATRRGVAWLRRRLWLGRVAARQPVKRAPWVQEVRARWAQWVRAHADAEGVDANDGASLERSRRAALVVSVCMLALSAAALWLHAALPSDGVLVDFSASGTQHDGFSVGRVLQPGTVRPGDIVVAVDGRSAESWSQGFFGASTSAPPSGWQRGQQHTYTILRNGQRLDASVPLGAHPAGAVLRLGG